MKPTHIATEEQVTAELGADINGFMKAFAEAAHKHKIEVAGVVMMTNSKFICFTTGEDADARGVMNDVITQVGEQVAVAMQLRLKPGPEFGDPLQ